ncbi:MAG: hypothetical protein KGP14_03290 [Betaproteobacteria bacterium]|nr:hypothetical protein [Betaproteobacteria bacterium]
MADNNGKELCLRMDRLFTQRTSTDALWQELADNFYPERGDFTVARVTQQSWGDWLFSTAPAMMRRDLGNAVSSMIRPGGRQWGKCDIDDEILGKDAGVRAYLDFLGDAQWHHMYAPQANFVRATKEADHDLITFGNSVKSVEADVMAGKLLYRCHHLKDCAWQDNGIGVTDVMCRKIKLTARQAAQFFNGADLSQKVRDALDKSPFTEFQFSHWMMPAADYEYVTKAKPKGKVKFVSIYVDVDEKKIMRESPSYEFRYVVDRWATVPNFVYGISPATLTALPDARMLQVLARIIQEAGEKSVDPPLKAQENAVRGDINLFAGGVTWVDREYDEKTGPALEPVLLGKDAGLGLHLFDRINNVLVSAFYLNKLSLPQQQGKTAYETAQLVEENLRASAPLFEPMEQNNANLLDVTFEILMRNGAFGPPDAIPQPLRGKNIQFTFSNPLHDAIEKAKMLQYQGVVQLTAQGMQLDQSIASNINLNQAYRDAVVGSGAPAQWLNPEEAAAATRAAAAKMSALQHMIGGAQAAGMAAQAVGDGASSLNQQVTQQQAA